MYYNLVMNKDHSPHYAHAIVTAASSAAAKATIGPLQAMLDRRFPEAQVVVGQFGQGPPVVADVEYRIFGPSLGGSVIEHLEQLPVRVRYADERRSDLGSIASTQFVRHGADESIPASALGELELAPELGGITRFQGERTNIIKGYTRNGALPIDVTRAVLDQTDDAGFSLPAGYRIELGGALEQDARAKGNLLIYVPLLVTLTVATLVLTFRSVKLAALLGVVAVLSIGLGLMATWLIRFPVSFNTILGTLGLIGLAFNNSIVVLTAIRANRRARAGDPEAMVAAVTSTTRHILSTTLTTIGGFVPLLVIVGGDFWPSLSIVLVGGVGGSMILALALALVPAAYVLMP